jgi:nitrogenase subunit NifH
VEKKKEPKKSKRVGMFIYCEEAFKKRLDRVRRFTSRTVTGYVIHAVKRQIEIDEAEMKEKGLF